MAEVTEIYSCREGQSLKEGKLDYSHDIKTKPQAEADAKRKCLRDGSLKKIVYYAVDEEGKFRSFFTYNNPSFVPAPRDSDEDGGKKPAKKARRKQKKTSWLSRLFSPRPGKAKGKVSKKTGK